MDRKKPHAQTSVEEYLFALLIFRIIAKGSFQPFAEYDNGGRVSRPSFWIRVYARPVCGITIWPLKKVRLSPTRHCEKKRKVSCQELLSSLGRSLNPLERTEVVLQWYAPPVTIGVEDFCCLWD